MATHHEEHDHQHGPNCGHTAVKHGDHCDDHGKIHLA